ncbi:hypothetical protein LTS10_008785 [Elasticomyces elasticus]|nr:hypothetical protein LTS10_008785 [Elasticomyces elasticus]
MSSAMPIEVPVRTSSLVPTTQAKQDTLGEFSDIPAPELELTKHRLRADRADTRKNLKRLRHSSSEYYLTDAKSQAMDGRLTRLEMREDWNAFEQRDNEGHDDEDTLFAKWQATDRYKELRARLRSSESLEAISKLQAERLDSNIGFPGAVKQGYWVNFISSANGMDIKPRGGGGRDSSEQSNLRKELATAYNALNPEYPDDGELWCPVLSALFNNTYMEDNSMTAAHIFPCKFGTVQMEAFFGEGKAQELMSKENVCLLSTSIEKRFDRYMLGFVPDCNVRNLEAVKKWLNGTQEYVVKVYDKEYKDMLVRIHPSVDTNSPKLRFVDLDGKRLVWKNAQRPRARYLWFHTFCCTLKESYGTPKGMQPDATKSRFGDMYWGTVGKYFKTSMLIGAAEQIGVNIEHAMAELKEPEPSGGAEMQGLSLEGVVKEFMCKKEESDLSLACLANKCVSESAGGDPHWGDDENGLVEKDDEVMERERVLRENVSQEEQTAEEHPIEEEATEDETGTEDVGTEETGTEDDSSIASDATFEGFSG